jgi:dTDP-4-dehydrorhamnose 3,5-epimerase
MIFTPTPLAGSFVVEPNIFSDDRGWFARFFCKDEFLEIGHRGEWVQLNHTHTTKKATVRGIHFQTDPFSEIKLVKCIAGAVFDVIVDLRENSSTFLNWFAAELSANNKRMLYIPAGFAHGFQCLDDNCELIYHHSEFYRPGFEGGVRYDDPKIKIDWPLSVTVISQRDNSLPHLDESFKGI